MRSLFASLACFFLATPAYADGVLAGHPVELRIAPGAGLTFTSLALPVSTMTVDFCGTTTVTYDVYDTFDAGDELLLPSGSICGLQLNLSSTTVFTGTGDSGGTFELDLQLAVIQIPVYPSVTVTTTSGPAAIELGAEDWVTATDLELGPNVNRVVTSSSTEHPALRAAVRDDSTVVP